MPRVFSFIDINFGMEAFIDMKSAYRRIML